MTELLAPGGSMEALKAAIVGGANAVYLGGKQFGARAFAENFDEHDLAEAIKLAHFHGCKIYLAVNTLIADEEMEQALKWIHFAYTQGVDALIIQDAGLMSLIRKLLPALPLHASTQMTIHNSYGANFLAAQGVERAILARELSIEQIAAIKAKTGLELEIFVHGALCICYSGQCLFSSMIGGRSGNRGRCAQPCRMGYTLVDEFDDEIILDNCGNYLLSPRDLFAFHHIEQLHALGVAAWKIEGRMKKPQYVAVTSSIYSKYIHLLDQQRIMYPNEEDYRKLLQIFNRDECGGYWFGNPGAALISFKRPNNRGLFVGRISSIENGKITLKSEQPLTVGDGLEIWVSVGGRIGQTIEQISVGGTGVETAAAGETVSIAINGGRVGDRVFKTYDKALNDESEALYAQLPEKKIDYLVTAYVGQPLEISATDSDGYKANVFSDYIVEKAKTSESDWYAIQGQLARLGGSGFTCGSVDGELDEGVMIPSSVLNKCRRELVEQLTQQHHQPYAHPPVEERMFSLAASSLLAHQPKTAKKHQSLPQIAVMVDDAALARDCAKIGIKDIYVAVEPLKPQPNLNINALAAEFGEKITVALPRIISDEAAVQLITNIKAWQERGIKSLLIENCSQIALADAADWQGTIYGGSGLNIFNSTTADFYQQQGMKKLTLSPELTLNQLTNIVCKAEKEVIAQGALELMVSEYCLLGAVAGGRDKGCNCGAPCKGKISPKVALRDEKGYVFPCRFDQNCRMHIFNSRQLCLLEDIPALAQAGVDILRLDLRLYPREQALRITELYRLAVSDDGWNLDNAWNKLQLIVKDYTKGHLYRGV